MSPLSLVLASARLCVALHSLPDVPADCSAAVAITLAADEHAPAELLAAVAWGESRFRPRVRNPRTGCAGPMGVRRFDVRRGELAGYQAGVRALHEARRLCLRLRNTDAECPLALYAAGMVGARERRYAGPRRVLRRARAIRRAADAIYQAPLNRPEGAS